MIEYKRDREGDLLMAHWWAHMDAAGELPLLFHSGTFSLGELLDLFAAPNELYYETDTHGVWFACWFEPFMSAGFVSVYVRHDMRKTTEAAVAYQSMLDAGLKAHGTLVSITKQPQLLAAQQALGYRVVGKLSGVYFGADAWITQLSREAFDDRAFKINPDDPTVAAYRPRRVGADDRGVPS